MKLQLDSLNKFISGVKALSGNAPIYGILLEILDNNVKLIYTDGKKALYNKVDAVVSDEEAKLGGVVFEYNTLADGLQKTQANGNLKVSQVDFDFSSLHDERVKASAIKYMIFEDGDKQVETQVSEIEFYIKAYTSDTTANKYKHLVQFDYDTQIFGNDVADTWNVSDFTNLIQRLSKGDDGKSANISSKRNVGFIVNRNSLFYISSKADINQGFIITKFMCKAMLDIISKFEPSTLKLSVTDALYCSIYTEDFGVWFEMMKFREIDGKMLGEYERVTGTDSVRAYNDIEILLNREATLDMVKASQVGKRLDSVDTEILSIDYDNSELIFGDEKSGMSKLGVQLRHKDSTNKSKLGVVYKVWEDILSNCTGVYVRLGIELKDEKTVYMRFADLDTENNSVNAYMYTISTERT